MFLSLLKVSVFRSVERHTTKQQLTMSTDFIIYTNCNVKYNTLTVNMSTYKNPSKVTYRGCFFGESGEVGVTRLP